eukprot:355370-Chlamydomonas_euryale.AAC.8
MPPISHPSGRSAPPGRLQNRRESERSHHDARVDGSRDGSDSQRMRGPPSLHLVVRAERYRGRLSPATLATATPPSRPASAPRMAVVRLRVSQA